MKREGIRFNVASNQTIKKCPLCTSWRCCSHPSETNIKERFNSDKDFRKQVHTDVNANLALSIHGHLIEKDDEALSKELKPEYLDAKRFSSGFISRNVGYSRKEHKKNYELKDRKDLREYSRFGKYYQKKMKMDDL